jgi:hypothetical protein
VASTITFRYRSGVTNYSRTFNTLSIKGLTQPDKVLLWPPLRFRMSDGSMSTEFRGFRRVITATLGVLQEDADRTFILNFLQANDRWIYFGTGVASIYCVLLDPEGFANEWKYDTSIMRYYDIRLLENVTYTVWPELVEPTADELLYIKSKVEITGTEASPQTFTTNAGALATDDTGNPYPAINLAAYAVTVILTEHQDSLVNRISDITQSGTDIAFTVAHSDVGNAYSDGKWYATIAIGLQAK